MSDSRPEVAVRADPRPPPSPADGEVQPRGRPPEATPAQDGRHARAERTHHAVLDGLRECLEIGIPQPTARQVATRTGVSLRGVFRHFEHLDTLLLELDRREHSRLAESMRSCPLEAPLGKRIDSFLARCARMYEGTSVIRRALQIYAETSATLSDHREHQRQLGHQQIATVFDAEISAAPAISRRELVQEISALTSWSHWEEPRRYEDFSVARTRRMIGRKLAAVLAADEGP